MKRVLLAGIGAAVVGGAGVLVGYRMAVRDYVENEAETIRTMADQMYEGYDKQETDELMESIMEQIEAERAASEEESDGGGSEDGGPSAFQ